MLACISVNTYQSEILFVGLILFLPGNRGPLFISARKLACTKMHINAHLTTAFSDEGDTGDYTFALFVLYLKLFVLLSGTSIIFLSNLMIGYLPFMDSRQPAIC